VTDFADFSINGNAKLISNGEIQLTPATGSMAGSAYWKHQVDLAQPWEARFTYSTVNPPSSPADGFAFALQRNSVTAVGAVGGGIAIQNITPSFGVAANIYGADTLGWVENGAKTGMASAINGIDLVKGVDVVVTYDGAGTVQAVFTQGDKVYTQTKYVNLAEYLGGGTAWMGVCAGTGGAVCDQRITNFRFVQNPAIAPLDLTVANDARWQLNQHCVYELFEGKPAFRLTDPVNNHTGSVVRTARLCTGRAFKIHGKYRYTGTSSSTPADGAAFFFHNNGTGAIGNGGGSVGVEGITTAIGWKLNLYNASRLVVVKNGGFGATTEGAALNGVDFRNQQEVEFTFAYRPGTLSLTVAQGEKSATVTQNVYLSEYFSKDSMYFAVSGATGGCNASQYVYDMSMEYDDEENNGTIGGGYGTLVCEGAATVQVAANAGITAAVGTLSLGSEAEVTVAADGAAGAPYSLAAHKVVFAGTPSERLITQSAEGTLRLGTVVYDGTRGNILKVVGAVAPLGEKITVRVPQVKGLIKLMDLTQASGVTLDSFVLDTDETRGAELRLENGVLYAIRDISTVIFIR